MLIDPKTQSGCGLRVAGAVVYFTIKELEERGRKVPACRLRRHFQIYSYIYKAHNTTFELHSAPPLLYERAAREWFQPTGNHFVVVRQQRGGTRAMRDDGASKLRRPRPRSANSPKEKQPESLDESLPLEPRARFEQHRCREPAHVEREGELVDDAFRERRAAAASGIREGVHPETHFHDVAEGYQLGFAFAVYEDGKSALRRHPQLHKHRPALFVVAAEEDAFLQDCEECVSKLRVRHASHLSRPRSRL
mmetsp:Transcript_53084/g.106450  ORF Transcript_53084/g.106450 Transcript_53084/m.106450 type:complete len:250 (+) Transcript_53084:30-779(+)